MSIEGMNKMSCPFVSVIIPVYNDPIRLKTCLQALEDQTYPKNSYEVIVVDNGSDKSIEPIVVGFSQARASYEIHPGSYAARNKGISVSRGEILAFIDSDCIPAPNWIERGVVNLLDTPTHEIVGGKVEFFFKDSGHPIAVELYDSMLNFDMKLYIERGNFTGAGNLFTFKRVFEHVGYFDRGLKSGGDVEWGQRAASLGYKLCYADDARVAHPARYSLAELLAKERRVAKGLAIVGRNLKKNVPSPLRWNHESIMEHLPPLPPVIKTMRLKNATLRTKMMIIVLWFVIRYIRIEERLRAKLRRKSSR